MKTFLVVLAFATVVIAEDDIDWSTVKRRDANLPLPFDLEHVVFDEKIVGGDEVIPNSIPYQAALLITTPDGTFFCGGSLVSSFYILTAAHCLDGAITVNVRLGAHRFRDHESTQQQYDSFQLFIHPGWNPATLENDIALFTTYTEVYFSKYVQPIALPRYSDINNDFNGEQGRISGWGLDSDNASGLSEVLREVFVYVMSNLECNTIFSGLIQPTQMCTSGAGGRGICSGDTGGPLVVNDRLVGIVSFMGLGLGCEAGWPSGFTRITSYLDWIAENSDIRIDP